jgi:hypothetical protein
MSDRQPYSRVYWSFLHDEKYRKARAKIEEDFVARHWAREIAALRGTWLLLLILHDQAFPAPAMLPASLHQPSLDLLVHVGFVKIIDGDAYEVCGLLTERTRRAESARRGDPVRDPNGTQTGPKRDPNGRIDETRRDETSKDEDDPPWLTAWFSVRKRLPTPGQQKVIDDYLRTFDRTGPMRLERLILEHPDDPIGAVIADVKAWREQRKAELATVVETPRRRGLRPGSVEHELAKMLHEREGT